MSLFRGDSTFRVQDLVLISYDFLLDSFDLIRYRKVDMVFILNHFYRELFNTRKGIIRKGTNPINIHSPFEEIVDPYLRKKNLYKNQDYYQNYIKSSLFPE